MTNYHQKTYLRNDRITFIKKMYLENKSCNVELDSGVTCPMCKFILKDMYTRKRMEK